MQSHFFFEIAISEQIASLYGVSYSFNLPLIILLRTYSINLSPLQFLPVSAFISYLSIANCADGKLELILVSLKTK